MKTSCMLLVVYILAGCSSRPALTNDQIIAETKKCAAAGMDAFAYTGDGHFGFSGLNSDNRIRGIQCFPKGTKPL